MPWTDIRIGQNAAHMFASGGVAHIDLLATGINLTGWGSEVKVAQVHNSSFYPAIAEGFYAGTRDSYYPTTVSVLSNGNVKVGYAGGTTGNRIVSSIFAYNIG